MLDKFRSRTIHIGGALILLAILIISLIGCDIYILFNKIRIVIGVSIYLLLALASLDFHGIEEMFNEIWSSTKKDIPKEEKLDMIKSFLESSCARWGKYWEMYQNIVNGGIEKPSETWKRVLDRFKIIYKGEINTQQIFWIFIYIVYSLIFSCNIIVIPAPIDIIVNIGITILILLTSGHILGMSKFLQEIFKIVSCRNEKSIEARLRNLEIYIKRGAKRFYYISVNGEDESFIIKKRRFIMMDDFTKQIIGYWILSIMGFFTPFLIGLLAQVGFDPLLTTFITGVWGSTATMIALIVRHHFKIPKVEEVVVDQPITPP